MVTIRKLRGFIPSLLALLIVIGSGALTGRAAAQSGSNVIDGFVFGDVNGNDVPDPGIDPGLSGVTLTLKDASGAALGTTTTAPTGEFTFSNLATGDYTVTETPLSGYFGIDVTPGTAAATIDVTTVQIRMVPGVDTYAGTVFLNRQQSSPPAGPNAISGFVFLDQNANGARDPGESWVNGAQVTLQDASQQSIAARQTTGFGQFAFSGLPNGSYTLVVTPPAGLVSTAAMAGPGGQVLNPSTIQITTANGTTSYDGQLFLVQEENGTIPPVVPPVVPPPQTQPNPSLTLSVDKSAVAPGDTLTYTLAVAAGQTGLSRGALFAELPPGTQWMDATTGGMLWGDSVVWSFGALAAGGAGTASFRARVLGNTPPGSVIQEQAQLLVPGQTTLVGSNIVSSIVITPGVPITLLTRATQPIARPGDTFTYQLTYANVSGSTLSGVQILDPLPVGLLFLGADTNVQVDLATRTLQFALGDLAPGASGTISIHVQVPTDQTAGAVFTNQPQVQVPGLSQPVPGSPVTVAVQLASFAGTFKLIQDPANPANPVPNPTSMTVDAADHFTLITVPSDQPAPSCLDAHGSLNPNGTFDVTLPGGQVRFTGQIDAAAHTATVNVQRTGFPAYTVSLPQTPDFNVVSNSLVGTYSGLAVNAAGDAIRPHLTIDAGGNATFEADVIQLFPTRTRCHAGAYQVTANGQLTFGGRVDGQLQANGNTLILTYAYVDPDGYQSNFQIPLTRE
jgi:uncharacterized repeat protein (TIGR01451 family)